MGALKKIELGVSLSLDLPDGMSFDQWVNVGRRLCAGAQVINWHIGDWWAFGDHRYGARAAAAAEGIFGRSFGSLANAASVCRSFETSRRREVLTWAHHVEVAALPPDVADQLLDRAETEGWSTRDLRREVVALRGPRNVAEVIDIRPEPREQPDIEGMTMSDMVVELAEALSRERALTDRESAFLERAMRQIRRGQERETEEWTASNELELIEMIRDGESAPEIAPKIDRTVGAVWRQINRLGGIKRIREQHGNVGRLGLANPGGDNG